MKKIVLIPLVLMLVCAFVFAGCAKPAPTPTPAPEEKFPQVLTFATLQPGAASYNIATALAKVLTQKLPTTVKCVSFTSSTEATITCDSGEAQLLETASLTIERAWKGMEPDFAKKMRNLRTLANVIEFPSSALAPAKLGISSVLEYKGYRCTSDYKVVQSRLLSEAFFKVQGLKEGDFTRVPVASPVDGVKAMIENRADIASIGSPMMPIAAEAESKAGAIFLEVPKDDEALWEELKGVNRSAHPMLWPAGTPGVKKDTWMIGFYELLATNKDMSDDVAYQITKTVWDNDAEIRQAGKQLSTLRRELMASTIISAPYHPGAIRFYKEMGVWTDEMQKANEALYKQ